MLAYGHKYHISKLKADLNMVNLFTSQPPEWKNKDYYCHKNGKIFKIYEYFYLKYVRWRCMCVRGGGGGVEYIFGEGCGESKAYNIESYNKTV